MGGIIENCFVTIKLNEESDTWEVDRVYKYESQALANYPSEQIIEVPYIELNYYE